MSSERTQFFNLHGAVAGLAILGSLFMFRKLYKLENQVHTNSLQFDSMIKSFQDKTQVIKEIGSSRQDKQSEIQQVEAKISSIQQTLQALEKLMHQQSGQLMMQAKYVGQAMKGGHGTSANQDGISMDYNEEFGLKQQTSFVDKHDKNEYFHRKMSNVNFDFHLNRQQSVGGDKFNIYRICLTGGPCAGKTTAIASIKQDLTQLGINVLVVPEAATALMKGGAFIVSNSFTESQGLQFQKCLMKLQVALEDSFIEIGKLAGSSGGNDTVILIDRGLMDGSAYVSRTQWQCLMDDLGVSTVQIRDNRYDQVIHMVTAADGAEKFYATEVNGEARYESVDEAKLKDEFLRQAYMGHQKWILIRNTDCSDFKEKIEKTKEAVLDTIGKSAGTHFHKKFLLQKENKADISVIPMDLSGIDKNCQEEIHLSETFIDYKTNLGEVISCSVEKKGSKNHYTYTLKLLILIKGQKLLKKRNISAAEYIQYCSQIKIGTTTLKTKRLCIIDNGVYIIVDYFSEKDGAPMLGIIQVRKGNQDNIELPKYVKVYRDVTDEDQYQPDVMCKENYYMDIKDKEGTKV